MTTEQANTYNVIDSMGRKTDIYVIASNLKAAYTEAKSRPEIKSLGAYWKLKRSYTGGVRG